MSSRGVYYALANAADNAESVSTKRLAWAYGCAKKGSVEEETLYRLLVERVANIVRETVR